MPGGDKVSCRASAEPDDVRRRSAPVSRAAIGATDDVVLVGFDCRRPTNTKSPSRRDAGAGWRSGTPSLLHSERCCRRSEMEAFRTVAVRSLPPPSQMAPAAPESLN